MKNTTLFATAALALLSLAACKPEREEVTSIAPDPQAEALKNAPPVELPPSIETSVSMRCKDNSLVQIDFFKGGTQALLKGENGMGGTMLKAPAAGEAYVAEGGYKIAGNAKNASVEMPGKGTRECRAG